MHLTEQSRGARAPAFNTIYACQERQNWYRNFTRDNLLPIGFVGSATTETPPEVAAARMNKALGLGASERGNYRTLDDALREFVRRIDDAGVLVMVGGVAGNSPKRPLDLAEFRGFTLSDPFAPLIFVNAKDTEAGRMFTLAHGLAHLWLGDSALSNIGTALPAPGLRPEEVWCNAVAAELLVPLDALKGKLQRAEALFEAMERLGSIFKVGSLVILRRLLDAEWITRREFNAASKQESGRLRVLIRKSKKNSGSFRHTTLARVGRRFAEAVVASALEGETLYRDAIRMLGISKIEAFNNLGRELGKTSGTNPENKGPENLK